MTSKSLLLVMGAAALSPGARTVLLCLIGLLLVTLGVIIFFALVLRRHIGPGVATAAQAAPARAAQAQPTAVSAPARPSARVGGLLATAGLLATGDAKACPSCRREFEGALQYCPHDARKLVPAPDMLRKPQSSGSMCTTCRRAFEPGVRFCPHDGSDLVPLSVYEATRDLELDEADGQDADPVATGNDQGRDTAATAKICPECRRRYGFTARFCSQDGSELAPLN